jgi:hypothetical protein
MARCQSEILVDDGKFDCKYNVTNCFVHVLACRLTNCVVLTSSVAQALNILSGIFAAHAHLFSNIRNPSRADDTGQRQDIDTQLSGVQTLLTFCVYK